MTMRGFETVGVRAVIQGLPEYLAGAKAITSANVGISGSLKGLDSVTNGFKLLAAAAAGVTAAIGGVAVGSAIKFESTLAKIDALTNTTAEDTEKLGKGILQLSKSVPKSPDELGAAAYFALSSGITDVDDALKLVTAASKASAAGLGSTADIVDIVTAAVNAYGPANLDAAHAVDVLVATVREGKGEPAAMAQALGSLLPLASALKIPFEDLAATFASLTNALGGSGAAEQAATQLRGILSQIASPSREAKNALAEAESGVKHLSESEIELAEAHKTVVGATEGLVQAQRGLRDAQEGVAQASRGVRDAQEGVVQAHRGVRDAVQAAADAQRDSRSATEALRNAYADLAAAQRNQTQASLDGRRETLSVLEAEQGLRELRTQAGNQANEVAAAELALELAREQASAKGKKTALEQRQAALAITQAEQRLNQVRAQGPRYALDEQNAILRLQEARNRVGTAQKQQDKDVADRQKNIVKATEDVAASKKAEIKAYEAVADAKKAEIKANEGVIDARRAERNAIEGVGDAQRAVTRQEAEVALAKEKEVLAVIHSRDAYADLRKEIAEKGLVPSLQRINELFADNQEGLAKLFPDVRGFIGFLSAITSQGAATASILDRIKQSTGITDEAFKRMSETTAFQASLLKNQFNVALIELGTAALPLVNAGLLKIITFLPQITEFFKKGLNGTQIGGEFSKLETAAFKAGEKVRELFDFIKQNKDSTLLPTGKLFLEGLQTVAEWFIDHKEALAAAFFLFAATNPLWAGILVGGAIIAGIGLLGASVDGLSDPFLRVRAEIDKTIIRMADFANTFLSLGLNKVPGVKDLIPTVVGAKGAEEDLAKVEAELKRRTEANAKAAEAARQLKQAQEEALAAGVPYLDFLKSQIEKYIAAGGTKMDEFLARLLREYEALPGSDRDFIANTKAGLQEAAPAALELANNLALVRPPNVGDAGRSLLDAATEASLNLGGGIDAIRPPNVGDAGLATLDAATKAAQGEQAALDDIEPPYVDDAGKAEIDLAAIAAANEKNQLAAIKQPNVGDAGKRPIDLAAASAWNLASALGTAAANAQKISLGSKFGTAARADGGVVSRPEFALIGEAGPEAVLPLTDPMRSRQIVSMLSPAFVASIMPRPFAEGGVFSGLGFNTGDGPRPTAQDYVNFRLRTGLYAGEILGASIGGEGGGGGGGGGSFTPIGGSEPASRQVYATLPPSLVRSMVSTRTGSTVGSQFDSLFGDVNIGSTSREVEEIAVRTVRSLFSAARTQSAIGGGLLTSGIG